MSIIIKQYEDLWIFKRLDSEQKEELTLIIKLLLQQKKWIRSRQIFEQIWIPKSKVDHWLIHLKKFNIIQIIGGNIKYIKDLKYGSICFPGEITNKAKEHLFYVYQDAILRENIQKLISKKMKAEYNTCLTPLAFTSMDIFLSCLESIVGERDLLQLYHTLFVSINEIGLYNPLLCRYWELQRQRKANRYLLKK